MTDINYRWIGWCQQDNHDKVWGVIQLTEPDRFFPYESNCLVFWGRRGKRLQTKVSRISEADAQHLINSKRNRGYEAVRRDQLKTVYPEFQADLEKTTTWGLLCQ